MKKKKKIERRNRIIIGLMLIIFMVSSAGSVILFYGREPDINSFTVSVYEKEYKFTPRQDNYGNIYYDVVSQNDGFTAFYPPNELNIDIDEETEYLIRNFPFFYLSFDPDNIDTSYSEFIRFDVKKYMPSQKFFIDALTKESPQYDLPVITCRNASTQNPVIILKNANITKVYSADNCVNIEFANFDTLKIRDMILYLTRGIDI